MHCCCFWLCTINIQWHLLNLEMGPNRYKICFKPRFFLGGVQTPTLTKSGPGIFCGGSTSLVIFWGFWVHIKADVAAQRPPQCDNNSLSIAVWILAQHRIVFFTFHDFKMHSKKKQIRNWYSYTTSMFKKIVAHIPKISQLGNFKLFPSWDGVIAEVSWPSASANARGTQKAPRWPGGHVACEHHPKDLDLRDWYILVVKNVRERFSWKMTSDTNLYLIVFVFVGTAGLGICLNSYISLEVRWSFPAKSSISVEFSLNTPFWG